MSHSCSTSTRSSPWSAQHGLTSLATWAPALRSAGAGSDSLCSDLSLMGNGVGSQKEAAVASPEQALLSWCASEWKALNPSRRREPLHRPHLEIQPVHVALTRIQDLQDCKSPPPGRSHDLEKLFGMKRRKTLPHLQHKGSIPLLNLSQFYFLWGAEAENWLYK